MKINVSHIAKLANLPLKENEIKRYESQLSAILDYIDKLKEAKTEKVEETSQTTGLKNVTRNDSASPSLSQKDALANAKSQTNGFFKVKAILEQ